MKQHVHWANLIVQLGLLSVAALYTFKTHQLVLATHQLVTATQTQIELTKAQQRTTGIPHLIIGFGLYDKELRIADVEESQTLTEQQKKELIEIINSERINRTVLVTNVSDQIPHNVETVVYDSRDQTFFLSETGPSTIAPFGQEYVYLKGEPQKLADAQKWVDRIYGSAGDFVKSRLGPDKTSYIALVCENAEGRLFLFIRPYELTQSGRPTYGRPLFFPSPQ